MLIGFPSTVLLVHEESVDPSLFFHLLQLKVPKDLLRNKGRNQLPYLCYFHTLKYCLVCYQPSPRQR